jgi:glycosyltransferase involved in cell wall biosynthesis
MSDEPRGRVLCITSNFPRWAGDNTTPFIMHLAQDLRALGWAVDVLAPHAPGAALRETLGGIHVERFRYFWPEALESVCYQGGALANLRRNPFNKLKLPLLVLCEWAGLFRRLRRDRYDLLHSHWVLPQGFTGALAAGPRRIPHVTTVHGSDVLALDGPVINRFKSFALRCADVVTANSSATRQAAARLAPDIRNLYTVPMGVSAECEPNPSRVAALRARYRREAGPLLVFAGRVVIEKGIEDLVSAIGLLASRLPDVTALIVGDGQDRSAIEAMVDGAGLRDRIAFTGWVAPETLPDYLAAGDMFVGPSWFEAQGLVFAEAMLAGTAVIATDVGGVSDTVRHGDTGLLVRDRAPAEIAAAVERLYREPAFADGLVAAGATWVRAHGMRSHSAKAFSDLFDSALGREPA